MQLVTRELCLCVGIAGAWPQGALQARNEPCSTRPRSWHHPRGAVAGPPSCRPSPGGPHPGPTWSTCSIITRGPYNNCVQQQKGPARSHQLASAGQGLELQFRLRTQRPCQASACSRSPECPVSGWFSKPDQEAAGGAHCRGSSEPLLPLWLQLIPSASDPRLGPSRGAQDRVGLMAVGSNNKAPHLPGSGEENPGW